MAVKNKNTFSYSSSIVCEIINLQCCMPLLDDFIPIQHHQTYLSYHMCSCSYCFGETWEGTGRRRCLVEGCSIGTDCWEGECNFFFPPHHAYFFPSLLENQFWEIPSKSQLIQRRKPCLMHSLQVSEERLISLLEQINNQTTKQTKVTVIRFCFSSIALERFSTFSNSLTLFKMFQIQRRRSVLEDDD